MNVATAALSPTTATPELDTNLLNQVVRQRKALKLALDAEAAAHNARAKDYKEKIAKIDAVLLRVLDDDKLPTYRSLDAGTVGTTQSTKYNIKDRAAFEAWVRSRNDLSPFSNALTKGVIDAWVSEHQALPPGVGAFVEKKITHNKTTT